MIAELFKEIAHEISAEPVTFGVEIVQFGLLLVIVKLIAFGFGKRKGFLVNMLSERRERVGRNLEAAAGAEDALALARDEAAVTIGRARSEAARLLLEARARAREALAQADADVERDATEMRDRANRILDAELGEMHNEVRDQLVELVADATRTILNEAHTPSEQRAIVQRAVLRGIEGLDEAGAPSREASS